MDGFDNSSFVLGTTIDVVVVAEVVEVAVEAEVAVEVVLEEDDRVIGPRREEAVALAAAAVAGTAAAADEIAAEASEDAAAEMISAEILIRMTSLGVTLGKSAGIQLR